MSAVVLGMPGNEALAAALARALAVPCGGMDYRRFPDGESYIRFGEGLEGRSVLLACSLHDPDAKALPLLLVAAAAKDLGAARVGLIAPYLGYMRQDKRFRDGEAVTSRAFAALLSGAFDWIATIDPHLHRYASMAEIYAVPVAVGHAAPLLASYLRTLGGGAVLVGPDEESEQWVGAVAAAAGLPHVSLRKTRHGDRDVTISFDGIEPFRHLLPILVDDMISSGYTMEAAVRELIARGFARPLCLAVHGILAEDAAARLERAGATVVTTNTIPGPTARIDVTPLLADLVKPHI